MRIPTEAELIEMERAADALAVLAEGKLADALFKEDRPFSSREKARKAAEKVERAELEAEVADYLTQLLALYRNARKVA
jgi:hypothetical protein